SYTTEAKEIGGLMWTLDGRCDVRSHASGKDRYLLSFMLVANHDRPSKFAWTAEGIIQIEGYFYAYGVVLLDSSDPTYSSKSIDEKGEPINPYSENPYPINKQFTFALDNNHRKGLTGCVCVIMDRRSAEERNEDRNWKYNGIYVKTRIHLTKITGVRRKPHFDFSSASMLSDVTLVVEDKELHVNKQYLSSISTVFRRMFDDSSSGANNRYPLEEVNYQDCVEFLRWIYPSSIKNFEEDGISRMLALAKKFNVPFIIDQIADFLHGTRDIFLALKIILHFGYEKSSCREPTLASRLGMSNERLSLEKSNQCV
ncbi:hypothetical protein PMAYCL1PPCAC_25710, partial [Pristionchus mayeri]